MATNKKHYHIEVLTDHGFSMSVQHWDTKEDAVRQANPISRNRVFGYTNTRTIWHCTYREFILRRGKK